ncbi:MAG: RHS repeat-associated core domain-containing protein [Saprospiraceae bacterium]|nr:RHS repeat-associated core domain-containing protein [Saprospiraceae bacterium]
MKLNHNPITWYPANSLNQTTVEDPNGNRSFTFTDKKGRLILSRRRNNSGTQEANTYNLYDNKDRLTTVIPPDATITNTNLIFKYLYDAADNMTSKDVPDAAAVTMKYNARNLMTLMQDGNLLAAPNRWLATNYDIYGRPVATGFKTATAPLPDSTFSFSALNKLTETTYDDPNNISLILKGKVKQSKVKVLDTANNRFITTEYSYDAHGRVSGTTANNHLPINPGSDTYAFTYDWADNQLTSTRNHKLLSTDLSFTTITETATYDHAGRAKLNKHKQGTAAEVTLSQLNYNAKDELVEKNLGVAGTNLQSLDYFYNDQGWLTRINQATLATSGSPVTLASCTLPAPSTTGNENDLFYLELKYEGQFAGMTGDTLQKNGNINQMQWRTRGRERQAYNFSYDYLDRLRSAVYADVNDAGTVTTNNRFNESLTYADARGNFSNLKRVGGKLNGACWEFAQIDNLTYSYTAGTNKISSISDAAVAVWKDKGFKDGSTGSYLYDVNGNMTTDPDKAMTIGYNHLNLPKLFTWTGGSFNGNSVEILYDAAGAKLRKTVKTGATVNYTQDYIGGIEYRDNVREAIYHAEGRVKYTSPTATRYEYTIKDHLGNARISFSDLNGNGVVNETNVVATNEVLQENHYYPFGLNTEGPWMNDAILDNKYQYNGKEWNDDFGLNLNDYGARWYDASVGRWTSKDPISEEYAYFTPFAYVANNPLKLIDPDGKRIIFVNGYLGFGSPTGGSSYWGGTNSGFVKEAKNYFGDNDAFFTDVEHGTFSTVAQRIQAGETWAKDNYKDIVKGLNKSSDVFRFVTHSMGAAFAEGISRYLKSEGWYVSEVYNFEPFQAADIETSKGHDETGRKELSGVETFVVDYQIPNDPVINNPIRSSPGKMPNADANVTADFSNKGTTYIHRAPIDTGDTWKEIGRMVNLAMAMKGNIKVVFDGQK